MLAYGSVLFHPQLQMIEECGRRFSRDEWGEACDELERVQEFLDMVKEVLPPPPPKAEAMQEWVCVSLRVLLSALTWVLNYACSSCAYDCTSVTALWDLTEDHLAWKLSYLCQMQHLRMCTDSCNLVSLQLRTSLFIFLLVIQNSSFCQQRAAL
jgi:hypothetical protein